MKPNSITHASIALLTAWLSAAHVIAADAPADAKPIVAREEIAAGPFAICYIVTMYLGSGGEAVVAPAAAGGKPLSVCGELAGMNEYALKLMAAGIDTISVNSHLISSVRRTVVNRH